MNTEGPFVREHFFRDKIIVHSCWNMLGAFVYKSDYLHLIGPGLKRK